MAAPGVLGWRRSATTSSGARSGCASTCSSASAGVLGFWAIVRRSALAGSDRPSAMALMRVFPPFCGQGGPRGGQQRRLLGRSHGPEIEQDPILLDANQHGGRPGTQASLHRAGALPLRDRGPGAGSGGPATATRHRPLPMSHPRPCSARLARPVRRAAARASARAPTASAGWPSMRRTGISCRARSGSRMRSKVASRAAKHSLSIRTVRASGFRRSRASRSRRPTRMPACGPPSSLSPLKVTRSTPARIASAASGSRRRPKAERSSSAPLPRSSMTGRPRRFASATSSPPPRRR